MPVRRTIAPSTKAGNVRRMIGTSEGRHTFPTVVLHIDRAFHATMPGAGPRAGVAVVIRRARGYARRE